MTIRLGQLLRLAFADLLHDRIVSFCQIVATAAVLAPLLVLFGLHNGMIGALIERLDRDPAMRLIVPEVTGSNRFDAAWFARIGARTDVAFVLPNTRAIAGQVDLLRAEVSGDGAGPRLLAADGAGRSACGRRRATGRGIGRSRTDGGCRRAAGGCHG